MAKARRDVLPARDKGNRLPTTLIEPVADVDDERNVDGPCTKNTEQKPMPDQELRRSAEGSHSKPAAEHDRPERDRAANSEALGYPTEC